MASTRRHCKTFCASTTTLFSNSYGIATSCCVSGKSIIVSSLSMTLIFSRVELGAKELSYSEYDFLSPPASLHPYRVSAWGHVHSNRPTWSTTPKDVSYSHSGIFHLTKPHSDTFSIKACRQTVTATRPMPHSPRSTPARSPKAKESTGTLEKLTGIPEIQKGRERDYGVHTHCGHSTILCGLIC